MIATNTSGSVVGTKFSTPSDVEFRMQRTFDAPRTLVFAAWTRPEHLAHWLLGPTGWTMPICEIDHCDGGTWNLG